ncbi:hypothetical protein LIER_32204 [Lithospermum erythrorhizon]|uniref:LTI65/LTI78 N-terminal domain-containing protein n=1 Tax=Lithospermum erythrorhizon TaxID=34254 RepID=A0AAV3RZ45_LITER
MAQLQRSSKSSEYSQDHPSNPSFEHLLQQNVSRTRSSGHEDHHKKSVFMKVKEKAKKLGRSLSGKKKHGTDTHDSDLTPVGGDKFVDAIEDDENPDYLGAPMYKSEMSSDTLKQNSRQHPPANPVVPGNHALSNCSKTDVKQGNEKPISPGKTIAQSEPDQLAPADAKASDATHSISSKIAGLKITNPNEKETEGRTGGTSLATSASTGTGNVSGRSNEEGMKTLERTHKSEPGVDEKALSEVISESLSPKKSPGQGVVEKVKEAVSSFLWYEEDESEPTIKNTNQSSQTREANYTTNPTPSSKNAVSKRTNPSPIVPVPTSTSEVAEDQSQGRILQTN